MSYSLKSGIGKVVYSCEEGYVLVGKEERLCNEDETVWTGKDPKCQSKLKLHL